MDKTRYFDIILTRSHLNDKQLYKLMGYKNQVPTDDILELIERLWEQLYPLCIPHVGYKVIAGKRLGNNQVLIDGIALNTGSIISEAMQEATSIAIFTATLGDGYNAWMKNIQEEDNLMHEFVANSMASIIVEGITEDLIWILQNDASQEELSITNNYSPGYCGWPLLEQKTLFSLLPDGISGITLTDSSLMLPIKSVSGIIGLGKNVQKRPYGCAVCNMKGRCQCSKVIGD